MQTIIFIFLTLICRTKATDPCAGWHVGNLECYSATISCPCGQTSVSTDVKCCKITTCLYAQACPFQEDKISCHQTQNCDICEVKNSNFRCKLCKNQAWKSDGRIDCGQDIDECIDGVGNANAIACEHNEFCKNSVGSYKCERCRDGYQLYDKRKCRILHCQPPLAPNRGNVIPTNAWEYLTFGIYSCPDTNYGRPLIIHGVSKNRCLAKNTNMYWETGAPNCTDPCDGTEQNALCESSQYVNLTEDECYQKGCCFKPEYSAGKNCFKSNEKMFIGFAGENPQNGTIIRVTHTESSGCAFLCSKTAGCTGYFIHAGSYSKSEEVRYTCNLLASKRKSINFSRGSSKYHYYSLLDYSVLNDHSNVKSLDDVIMKSQIGCIARETIKDEHRLTIKYKSRMTIRKCYEACRDREYGYALLTDGHSCACASSIIDALDENGKFMLQSTKLCNMPCSGNENELCGGKESSSIYYIAHDDRYIGCYETGRLAFISVASDTGRKLSPDKCIRECRMGDYLFAGISHGGSCSCSNDSLLNGVTSASNCDTQCEEGSSLDNCGGTNTSAVYTSEKGLNPSYQSTYQHTRALYFPDISLTEVPMFLFTEYPLLKSITSSRFIIHATQEVMTPYLQKFHYSKESYRTCGQIRSLEDAVYKGKTVIIRAFEFSLENIKGSVGPDTKQVFVYAQVVYITKSANYNFSLLIRARRIVIDRNKALKISISPDTPAFDMAGYRNEVPQPNPLFLKISYACVRMLMDVNEVQASSLAWAMLFDLTKPGPYEQNVNEIISEIKSYQSLMLGIHKEDIHFVPKYNQKYYERVLDLFYGRIKDYDKQFTDLKAEKNLQRYSGILGEMLNIQMDTIVNQAKEKMEYSKISLKNSLMAFKEIRTLYQKARNSVMNSPQLAPGKESNVQQLCSTTQHIQKAIAVTTDVIKTVAKVGKMIGKTVSIITSFASAAAMGPLAIVGAIFAILDILSGILASLDHSEQEAKQKFQEEIDNLNSAAFESSHVISQLEFFFDMMEEINYFMDNNLPITDTDRYLKNSRNYANLKVGKVKFDNLKNGGLAIMSNKRASSDTELLSRMRDIMDYSNAAAALADSSVELFENVRQFIQSQTSYRNRLEEQTRFHSFKEQLKSNSIPMELMTANLVEQMFDVELELNNYLSYFCQSYFYLHLNDCPSNAKPDFGADISKLLSRIFEARRLALDTSENQITKRVIYITDPDNISSCLDMSKCPIRSFKKTKMLQFNITLEEPQMIDLEFFRVTEITVKFIGAISRRKDKGYIGMKISSGGLFYDRRGSNIYTFVSSAFSADLQYDVRTGEIIVRTKLFEGSDFSKYITPFTTWTVKLIRTDEMKHIDFSTVVKAEVTFFGGANLRNPDLFAKSKPKDDYFMYYIQ